MVKRFSKLHFMQISFSQYSMGASFNPFLPLSFSKSNYSSSLLCSTIEANAWCQIRLISYWWTRDIPGIALVITFFMTLFTKNAPFCKFYSMIVTTILRINGKNSFGCPFCLGRYIKIWKKAVHWNIRFFCELWKVSWKKWLPEQHLVDL